MKPASVEVNGVDRACHNGNHVRVTYHRLVRASCTLSCLYNFKRAIDASEMLYNERSINLQLHRGSDLAGIIKRTQAVIYSSQSTRGVLAGRD